MYVFAYVFFIFLISLLHFVIYEGVTNKYNQINWVDFIALIPNI